MLRKIQRQIADMISRGIDGVVIDWYGPNNAVDQATKAVMHEAEKHAGFHIRDHDRCGRDGKCLLGLLIPGRVDAVAAVRGEDLFRVSRVLHHPRATGGDELQCGRVGGLAKSKRSFENSSAILVPGSGRVHSRHERRQLFVGDADDPQLRFGIPVEFLPDRDCRSHEIETMGATYKGFNDALAGWGSGRAIDQQCGQTWLQTFSQINSRYNSGRQLPYLQLVTWNDYEEGTELESGIDSCFSLEASVSGNTLEWSTSGNENTVDHYAVYSSQDGQNMTPLTQTQPGDAFGRPVQFVIASREKLAVCAGRGQAYAGESDACAG